ncbi:MAG: site-specific integrase [Candidatus Acidiferrum sp.]
MNECPRSSCWPHDSLARLVSSTNPESGTLNYNLVQFRAHRGLQGSHIGGHIVYFYNVSANACVGALSLTFRRTAIRRWDRLLDSYIEEYRARGVSPQSVAYTEARLNRWGRWLKGRRPRVGMERIDAEMIARYIANCSSFRAKATVYAMLSSMRGFGDYLVRQGLWKINPLR